MKFGFRRRQMRTPKGYKFCLITYIDLLGFRARLLESEWGEIKRLIHDAARVTQICGLSVPAAGGQPWRRVCHFQDSLVAVTELGWAVDQPEDIKEAVRDWSSIIFAQEIENICNIQMNFVRRHILTRGAIATGQVGIDGESVLGPGFLRALELEQRVAKYPRVVVAPELLGVLDQAEPTRTWLANTLTRDNEGTAFVNYLWGSSVCYLRFQDYLDLLKEHQDLLLELQQQANNDEGLGNKLAWLIEYHNGEVDRVAPQIRQRYICNPREWSVPPAPHPSGL